MSYEEVENIMINFKDKDLIAYKRFCIERDYVNKQLNKVQRTINQRREKFKKENITESEMRSIVKLADQRLCIERDYLNKQLETIQKKINRRRENLIKKGIEEPGLILMFHINEIPIQ